MKVRRKGEPKPKVKKVSSKKKSADSEYKRGYNENYNKNPKKLDNKTLVKRLNNLPSSTSTMGGSNAYIRGKNAAFRTMLLEQAESNSNVVKQKDGTWIYVDGISSAR